MVQYLVGKGVDILAQDNVCYFNELDHLFKSCLAKENDRPPCLNL